MAENSKIEWCHHTFNPFIGCTKISQGCHFCYAETLMDKRWGKVEWGPQGERKVTSASMWRQPLKWDKQAREQGQRARVFCGSLCDVFEDRPDLNHARLDLMTLIEHTHNLDWLLLTKRPENVNRLIERATGRLAGAWLADCKHVWVGTSVEDQVNADKRIPELLQVPAAIRFLSCEPLLGPIDLRHIHYEDLLEIDALTGDCGVFRPLQQRIDAKVHWVIVGGESGPGARQMKIGWARNLIAQCWETYTPVFMKQVGSVAAKTLGYKDKKGGNIDEWLSTLQVRQFPLNRLLKSDEQELEALWPEMPDLEGGIDRFAQYPVVGGP